MKATLLFAVVAIAPVGATSTAVARVGTVLPTAVPRVLGSGAPACGNVAIWKLSSWPEPECREFHEQGTVVVTSVVEQAREIGSVLAAFDGFGEGPLTVAEARRPGS